MSLFESQKAAAIEGSSSLSVDRVLGVKRLSAPQASVKEGHGGHVQLFQYLNFERNILTQHA